MTFVRASDGSRMSFDSSPQYSLPKAYGWAPNTVELEKTVETPDLRTFTVRARSTDDSPLSVMGVLHQTTKEAIWRKYK